MIAENIDSRIAGIREDSSFAGEFLMNYSVEGILDDSFGWGGIMEQLLNTDLSSRPSGVILTGQEGVGKHQAAAFLVKKLKEENYDCIFLNGSDFTAEADISPDDLINPFIDDLYDSDKGYQGLCLILEDIQTCGCYQKLMRCLTRTIVQNRMTFEGGSLPIFVIIISEEELRIPAMARKALQVCRLGLPEYENRLSFLTGFSENLRFYVSPSLEESELTMEKIAAMTEGLNYNQLNDIIQILEQCLCIDYSKDPSETDELIKEIILTQMPEIPEKEEDWRKNLAEDISTFLRELPETLKNLPAAAYIPQQNSVMGEGSRIYNAEEEIPIDDNMNRQPTIEEIEKLPATTIANDWLGEERANELLEYCRKMMEMQESS